MSRAPLPPVTIALDPGFAAWMLRHHLRRAAAGLGRPALDPLLPIAGPFRLGDPQGLAGVRAAVEAAVPMEPYLAYTLDGVEARPSGRGGTIGLRVRPSAALAATADAVGDALSSLAAPGGGPDERFLVPIIRTSGLKEYSAAASAFGLARLPWHLRLRRLFRSSDPAPALPDLLRPVDACRLLVLLDGRPAAALDLPGRRWLGRAALPDRGLLGRSFRDYRRARGLELAAPAPHRPGETWLLADLHLGHPGIALYTARPFLASDVGEMDRVLVGNWRDTVAPEDRAVLLGDLCAGPDPGAYRAAVAGLTGRLILVRGNHDPDLPGLARSVTFEAGGHRFHAVHDPVDAPRDAGGWVVHGHVHDSDLRRFPFFDPVARRVNVSVETAGYRPVPLSLICDLIRMKSRPILVRGPEQLPPDAPAVQSLDTSLINT